MSNPSNLPEISTGRAVGGLMPTTLEGMVSLSKIMNASGLMPKGIDTAEKVFVCMQMGLEVGLSPMQAVQNIAPINGRPSIWGDAALALVEAAGVLEDFQEFFEGEWPKDTFKAVCIAHRRGRKPARREFSVADAKAADLWSKAGPWKQYPKRMMQMRARSWALRDTAPDVLKGMRLAEEQMDVVEVDQPVITVVAEEAPEDVQSALVALMDACPTSYEKPPDPEALEAYVKGCASASKMNVVEFVGHAIERAPEFYTRFFAKQPKPAPATDHQDLPTQDGLGF